MVNEDARVMVVLVAEEVAISSRSVASILQEKLHFSKSWFVLIGYLKIDSGAKVY